MEPSSAYEAGQTVGRVLFTILLSLIPLGALVMLIVGLIRSIRQRSAAWIIVTVVSGLIVLGTGAVMLVGYNVYNAQKKRLRSAKEAEVQVQKQKITSQLGNATMEVPANWKPNEKLNADAVIAMGDMARGDFLILISNLKLEFEGDYEDFDQLVLNRMVEASSGAKIEPVEVLSIPGTKIARMRKISAKVKMYPVTYFLVSVETEGYLHQILAWTLSSREKQSEQLLREAIMSFREIEGVASVSVEDRIKDVLVKQLDLNRAAVKPEADLRKDLGADDLDCVELVMALEEEFEVEVPDDVAKEWKQVADLTQWFERQASEPKSK